MTLLRTLRRTSAVLAVDVVGYTRLMELDEEGTHIRLMRLRAGTLDPTVAEHRGRVVKNTGDGFLAAFDDPADAARCAVAIQMELIERERGFPADHRILLRMGLNVSDTIVEAEDIYGEGVNVAARLQAYAEPGDIMMSAATAEQVADVVAGWPTYDLGELHLRNITRPVRARGLRIGSARSPAVPARPRGMDARPSIAVLPFRGPQSRGCDPSVAEGIVEEIVHWTNKLDDLFVISHASTLRYSDRTIDPRAVGAELGVHYLLCGSVQCIGRRLRIGTELIEAKTAQVIHSERYEGDLQDLFGLQSQVALATMKMIARYLPEHELRGVMRKHPDSLTVHDILLKALDRLYRLDYESHARARGFLQQAIALDPEYSPVFAYTAYWHIFRVGEGWSSDPDADSLEAVRAARAALDRNPDDALALAIFGHVQSFMLRDYETAMTYLDHAIEVGPNCATAWTMNSVTCGYMGDGPTAVARAEQALRIAPMNGHVFWHETVRAQAHYINGEHEEAAAWARKSAMHNPSALCNRRLMAASLAALGRHTEARRAAQDLMRMQPGFRLGDYARRCPFKKPVLDTWIERLRSAGLPD